MALTINTNMGALQAQHALNNATNSLNASIERMTTGYKINSASDDAAGMAVATKMETKLGAVSVAESNAELGSSLLNTIEGNYGVIQDHLQRIRDLTEQAANGTYATDSRIALQSEIEQRLDEIDRVTRNTEYNGMYLLSGVDAQGNDLDIAVNGLDLQVGINSSIDSVVTLDASLFRSCLSSSLLNFGERTSAITGEGVLNSDLREVDMAAIGSKTDFAKLCAGLATVGDAYGQVDVPDPNDKTNAATDTATDLAGTFGASQMLAVIDYALADISDRTTLLGATQNRVDSATEALQVQSDNLTSSLSTVRDADVAAESSAYVSAQILQQASATLLTTANQTPSIALNLL